MLAVTIRDYERPDAAAMAQLYFDSARILGLRFYSPEQVAAWAPEPRSAEDVVARASDGRTTLVAVRADGEIMAYADLEADGHIDHLYCRPEDAGKGIASRLIDAILERAAAAGIPRLTVEASELARPVFARKGFTVVERRDFVLRGTPIHNYAMARALPAMSSDP